MPDQEPAAPRSIRAVINPDLLLWARNTAGLSLEAAAKKLGVKPARLRDWEENRLAPTVTQLRKAANVYKRPLAVFFLPQAPVQPEPLHDFRHLPASERGYLSPELRLEMRRSRRRRSVALELFHELDQEVPTFGLQAGLEYDPENVAEYTRDWLGVPLAQQTGWSGPYDALNGWLAAFEARGFLVFQTSEVELEEMRGFSLAERRLPVITLNAKDYPRARVFTLLHELAHVTLGTGGVCDPDRVLRRSQTADERVEVFCNHVAGSVLVPSGPLLNDPRVAEHPRRHEWQEATISALANTFTVSREVILRRLLILHRTVEDFYERKRREYQRQYARLAALTRERAKEQEGRRPAVYRIAVRDNGRRYTRLILDAFDREQITAADVSDYLGVRLKHLDRIADAVDRRRVEA